MRTRGARRPALGVALLLFAPALVHGDAAAGDADLGQLMSLLAQRRHGEALFTEEKYLSVLKQPLKSSGELIYDAPDHLEERVVTPRPQSIVLDHGVLSMHIGAHMRTVRLADYPELAPLIDSIRATLAGDRAALERVFAVEYAGSLDDWRLNLTPRDPRVGASLAWIELQGARDAVREVRVSQRDGDRSIMHITPRE